MRKFINIIVTALFIMPLLASCKGDGKVLSIGEPEFVSGFPKTLQLKEIENFNCDEMGLSDVKVVDSLLIISKADTWTVYSLDGNKKYGKCMRVGNGPGEFTHYLPSTNWCYFFKENDSLFVYASDTYRAHVLGFNVSELLAGVNNTPHPVIETDLIMNAIPAIPYGKDKILVYQPEYNYTKIKRMMYEGDTLRQMPVTHGIDQITLSGQADMNILSRITCYNAAADKFVEAMVFLNQINTISGDGSKGKTICVGKRLDDISKLEKKDYFELRNCYVTASAWDEGFGAAYSGAIELLYQQHLSNDTQIQFFDWVGNPKCLVELPYQISSFDIDFAGNIMYVIDSQNDKLIAYDATEIVKCLKS